METGDKNKLRKFRVSKKALLVIDIVVNTLLITMLLLSAHGGKINPASSTVGAIVAMGFPFAIIANLIALVINLIWFRKVAIANGVAFLLCIGPMWTYCPLNIFRGDVNDENRDRTFSLLTYNVYEFMYYNGSYDHESPNLTLSYIINRDADIVCLQEAEPLTPLERWKFRREQFDTINTMYPWRHVNDKTGLAILSKYPMEVVPLERGDFEGTKTADFNCYRLDVEGHPLTVFNVHLQSIGLNDDDKIVYRSLTGADLSRNDIKYAGKIIISKLSEAYKERALQARLLRQMIDSIGGNIIVCGDFNDIPGSYSTRTVKGGTMTDAFSKAGIGPSVTYHASRFYFRIDHIFYQGDFKALRTDRNTISTSDHYPLFSIFEWNK